jgi:hypothetical protein
MLSLSFMPHHHHGEVSCFNVLHCAPEEVEECDHDHPAPANENDCLANILAEVPPARQSLDEDSGYPDLAVPLCFLLFNEVNPVVEARGGKPFAPPYEERLHTCLLTRAHAGRAPPVG